MRPGYPVEIEIITDETMGLAVPRSGVQPRWKRLRICS